MEKDGGEKPPPSSDGLPLRVTRSMTAKLEAEEAAKFNELVAVLEQAAREAGEVEEPTLPGIASQTGEWGIVSDPLEIPKKGKKIPEVGSGHKRVMFNLDKAVEHARGLDASDIALFKRQAIIQGVSHDTWALYKGRIQNMISFSCILGYPGITDDSFILFLHAMDFLGMQPSTMDGYRCAYKFFQLSNGLPITANSETMLAICKGLAYRAGDDTKIARGPITYKRLCEVLRMCEKYERPDLMLPIEICYLAALRYSQLLRYKIGDASFDDENAVVLILRRDKRRKAGNCRKRSHIHGKHITCPRLSELLDNLQTGAEHGSTPFKNFDVATARKIIRLTAKENKWPADLYYDGVHCLRHGGVQGLNTTEKIIELLKDQVTQMTGKTRQSHYAACRITKTQRDNSKKVKPKKQSRKERKESEEENEEESEEYSSSFESDS